MRPQVLNVPEVPRVFMGSFWDQDETNTDEEWLGSAAHAALLEREKSDLLRELVTLPQNSIMRRVSELVRAPPAPPRAHRTRISPAPRLCRKRGGGPRLCPVLRVCPAPPPLLLPLPVSLLYNPSLPPYCCPYPCPYCIIPPSLPPSLPPSPDKRGAGSLTNPGHRATRLTQVKRARAVKVHAYVVHYLRKQEGPNRAARVPGMRGAGAPLRGHRVRSS